MRSEGAADLQAILQDDAWCRADEAIASAATRVEYWWSMTMISCANGLPSF